MKSTAQDNNFKYKCICDWSKDDEFGFIPNTECPVHGKETKETLSKTVPINIDELERFVLEFELNWKYQGFAKTTNKPNTSQEKRK